MNDFHRLFFASREELWADLAQQLGGTFTDGGWWKQDRIDATHAGWVITLDTYKTGQKYTPMYTRLRVLFLNPDSFQFTVKRAGFLSDLAAKLGHPDVEIGFPEFDRAFVVKTNNADKVRQLFADATLRSLLIEYGDVMVAIAHDDGIGGVKLPFGTNELRFMVAPTLNESRLRELYEVFVHTLDRLCQMGSAAKGDPGLRL